MRGTLGESLWLRALEMTIQSVVTMFNIRGGREWIKYGIGLPQSDIEIARRPLYAQIAHLQIRKPALVLVS